MRKEANLKEWKKLYDLAEKYVKMKPWELLNNEEMVCVSFSEEDRAYFTIMGNGGMEYGFGMYVGDTAFREMQLLISDYHSEEYSLYMQNCVVMFIDRKEDVPEEQMEIIRKLGRNYGRGRGWIYFENHARGYAPYIPDQQDVLNTARFLEKLIEALEQIEKVKPRGMHLMGCGYIHELKDSEWKTGMTEWNQEELKKLPFTVDDEALKAEATKWKKRKVVWEVDIITMDSVINDEKYDRPLFPYLLLAVNHSNGQVVYQQLLEPADDPASLCQYMIGLMKEYGMPEKIVVFGKMMKEIFSPLQNVIGLKVETGRINHLMEYAEGLKKNAFHRNPGAEGRSLKAFGLKDDEIAALLEMSGADTEEELIQMLGKMAEEAFGNGNRGLFLMDQEEEDSQSGYSGLEGGAYDGFDEDDEYHLKWQEPKNMSQRIHMINDFFEFTDFEEGPKDYDESYDELCEGVIYADWCDDWERILGECSIEKLKEMAKAFGIASGKKKAQIASEVSGVLMEKPARVKELLSREEKDLIRQLRTLANKGEGLMSGDSIISSKTVISLVEKGMADIRYGNDVFNLYLEFKLPKQMKGLQLN